MIESGPLQEYVLRLNDAVRFLASALAVVEVACAHLGAWLGAGQVAFAEIDAAETYATIHKDWNDGSIPSNVGRHQLRDFGPMFVDDLRGGAVIAIDDVRKDHRTADAIDTFHRVSIAAFLNVPLIKEGKLVGVLAVHTTTPRVWTQIDIAAAIETADRTWAEVLRARAETALRRSEERLRQIFNSIDEGYCLCELLYDSDGSPNDYRFLEVNPLFERMTGIINPVGRTAYELLPELEPFWVSRYARVALNGEALRFESHSVSMGRHFDVFATPVAPLGHFALVFKDVSEQKRTQLALRDSTERLRLATEAGGIGIWSWDATTDRLVWDNAWAPVLNGRAADTTQSAGQFAAAMLHPQDQDMFQTALGDMLQAPSALTFVVRFFQAGGPVRWVELRGKAFGPPETHAMGWVVGTARDITRFKERDHQVELLVREVSHRSKNMLAVVNAVARHAARSGKSNFLPQFSARVQSLATTHDLLVHRNWQGVELKDLLLRQLAPLQAHERINLVGAGMLVSPTAAQNIGMITHELAFNALQHGALSNNEGRVDVAWQVNKAESGDDPKFRICWKERHGPPVHPTPSRGFGCRVIESVARDAFSGSVSLSFTPSGFQWNLTAPLEKVRFNADEADHAPPFAGH